MGASRTVRRCAGPCGKREASGGPPPAIWTPGDSTPLDWLDVGAAGAAWTTTGKTVAVTSPGDPIGALVQQGGLGLPDYVQATLARRPTLASIGGQLAATHDHVDDGLSCINNYPSNGAKTLGLRMQYNAAIGTAEVDVVCVVGGVNRTFQVRFGGATSTQPGLSFAADVSGATVPRRVSTWIPTTAAFSLVVVYKGGGNTTTANYSVWVDRTPLTINTTGSSFAASTASWLLQQSTTTFPVNGKFSKFCVVAEDKSASVDDVFDWLEA